MKKTYQTSNYQNDLKLNFNDFSMDLPRPPQDTTNNLWMLMAGASIALGSDTGGSIRQPAALCRVVGHKPTYGLLSRYGLISFASSLDTVGLIAKSVRDIKYTMPFIAGKDPKEFIRWEEW